MMMAVLVAIMTRGVIFVACQACTTNIAYIKMSSIKIEKTFSDEPFSIFLLDYKQIN